MASSLALRRVAGSGIFRPVRSLAAAPSFTRSFNTNTQMVRADDDERDERSDRAVTRRREFPGFFSDVFDPFSPTRSVSQLMNLMDQFMENPFLSATRGMGAGAMRRGWNVCEDENALHLKVDMPGLGKDDVKVSVEENTLIIKGEGLKESEDEELRRYSTRIDLTPNAYKIDEIKAEMKNGVLRVSVPKLKEEERRDAFQVQVE
uniref:HSP23.5 n=1 Tax=Selenicereus monacanthus TaxID=1195128 RepID=A0AA50H460_9CARY|nr:HSP23.6-MITO [Selenicereus monacanthus]WLR90815.1 HSP23.5 [Selenicereus monacanthus]